LDLGVLPLQGLAPEVEGWLEERPDLDPALFGAYPLDAQGQHRPGSRAWFSRPICRLAEGRLNLFFIPWYIRECQ